MRKQTLDHTLVIVVMFHIQHSGPIVSIRQPRHFPAPPAGLRPPVAVARPIGVGRASSGMNWRRPFHAIVISRDETKLVGRRFGARFCPRHPAPAGRLGGDMPLPR